MELADLISYGIALAIGLIMGLIGGGGSLLLPTFRYLLKMDGVLASAYTLLLVGVTAVIGVIPRIKSRQIDLVAAISLAVPIYVGTLISRTTLYYLPKTLIAIGEFELTLDMAILLLFATVLLLSFASMLGIIGKNLKPNPDFRRDKPKAYFSLLILGGLVIGLITGPIGAGGGVMIVPLLVLVMGLEMKCVVGTSLAVMAMKSPIGFFTTDAIHLYDQIEWGFLLAFAAIMIAGVLIGTQISKKLDNELLKKGFAWFILFMAIFIFVKEIFFPT